jgi:MFS superfamily sulfate permease-like transporter
MRTRIVGLVVALAAILALALGTAAHADPVTELYGTCAGTTNFNT